MVLQVRIGKGYHRGGHPNPPNVFTRRGDQGETDTGSRKRVAKSSSLINLEGTIDETISFIGFATVKTRWEDIRQDLRTVQEDLFTIGEEITSEGGRKAHRQV